MNPMRDGINHSASLLRCYENKNRFNKSLQLICIAVCFTVGFRLGDFVFQHWDTVVIKPGLGTFDSGSQSKVQLED